jgi:CHAT domain-containing protein
MINKFETLALARYCHNVGRWRRRIGPALSKVSRGGVRHADGSKTAVAVTSTDHPSYWAPFILMGNRL